MLAVAAGCGLCAVTQAQSFAPDNTTGYADTAYGAPAMPENQPAASNASMAADMNADQSDLAKRVADLEKALKKADDKAKEDKKKAASKMSATPFGRIILDGAMFTQDAIDKARVNEQNGVGFRSARLGIQGEGFDVLKYKIEMDFAGNAVAAKDVYMTICELPVVQNIQIGHFKEPFSLDELTSAKYITFMERNLASQLMAPSRHIGVMAQGHSESEYATYAVGGFAEQPNATNQLNDVTGGALTMRGTWLAWYDEATEGRGLLHTGIAYSYRKAFNHQWVDRYNPESYLAGNITNGTLTDVDTRNMIGLEAAMVYGPFSVQSEAYVNYIDRISALDAKTTGGYIYFSYFLTGENRPYSRATGVFDRVKPFENFFRVRDDNGFVTTGKGAWEFAYRVSYLDCYDNGRLSPATNFGVLGGQTTLDHTVGLNWYLNPYTRMMFEYVHSAINMNTNLGAGDLNTVQMRAQIDF
jgi:phosphate-selective porin OprO/OprP